MLWSANHDNAFPIYDLTPKQSQKRTIPFFWMKHELKEHQKFEGWCLNSSGKTLRWSIITVFSIDRHMQPWLIATRQDTYPQLYWVYSIPFSFVIIDRRTNIHPSWRKAECSLGKSRNWIWLQPWVTIASRGLWKPQREDNGCLIQRAEHGVL